MKKNFLVLAVLSFALFSCGETSGGNKGLLPVDTSAATEEAHITPESESENKEAVPEKKEQEQPGAETTDQPTDSL